MFQYDQMFFELMQRMYRDKPKKQCEIVLAPIEFFTLMTITVITKIKSGEIEAPWADEIKRSIDYDREKPGEGTTVGELVKLSKASMSSVSRKVTALEKKGYVERIPAKSDRRVIFLRPTEAGAEICIREREKQIALRNYVAQGLGEDKFLEMLMLANRAFDLRDAFYAELEAQKQKQE